MKLNNIFLIVGLISLLVACGGSSGGDKKEGSLTMNLTDAPVDSLQSVVVTITGVTLKPKKGEAKTVSFSEQKVINMLDLQNGTVETLLDDYKLEAGTYEWVRLELSTEDGALYVEDDMGGLVGLTVPSGFQTGLKLNHEFVIPQGGDASFTIDFDLRKSVVKPEGQDDYFLKPSLRLVDNASVGKLEGDVSSSLIQTHCTNSGNFAGLVYVFSGSDVAPDDYDELSVEAIAAGKVAIGENGLYEFTVPFISAGNYTVAYSCDPDDSAVSETLNFIQTQNALISTNSTTQLHFE